MGSGASSRRNNRLTKKIFLNIRGKVTPVEFSVNCDSRDLRDLFLSAAGLSRGYIITLTNHQGSLVPVSNTLLENSEDTCYQLVYSLEDRDDSTTSESGTVNYMMRRLSDELSKAFKIEQLTNEFSERLTALEKRFEAEDERVIEIDKCKEDIEKLTGTLLTKQATIRSLELEQQVVQSRAVPHYHKYNLSKETINYLKKPTFNIWHWETGEMLSLIEHMYEELGLLSELKINPIILRKWLIAVQEHYRDNPFHNFRHCFCVTQMMYGMINLCNLTGIFSKLEITILLTSAVCHDLDHPGFNNNYQINARTELAIRYNDKSPLENHHCAVAFQILANPEHNIFRFMSEADFKMIRSGIIELILATDMAKHTEIMDKFKVIMLDGLDYKNDEHRSCLKMMLIKCCDVSNEVRPMEVSEPWVDCLLEEYFMQSDREKEEGLPVAPFMDRDKVTKPTAQIGFIKFVLIPVFELMKQLFPEVEKAMLHPLKKSLDHYEQLKRMDDLLKEEERQKAKHSPSRAKSTEEVVVLSPLKHPPRKRIKVMKTSKQSYQPQHEDQCEEKVEEKIEEKSEEKLEEKFEEKLEEKHSQDHIRQDESTDCNNLASNIKIII